MLVCILNDMQIYKKRGLCYCLFRVSRPSHCLSDWTSNAEPTQICTHHTHLHFKPDTIRSAHKCMQRDDTHPEDIQRCNAPNPINESCEVSISSKQSVIRRLYKICSQTHPWRRHLVADYAVRTTLRGLCNCKDTSKILNTQTTYALFEPRKAIICENGIFCVPLQAKRD